MRRNEKEEAKTMLKDHPVVRRLTDAEVYVLTLQSDTEEAPWMVMTDFQWNVVALLMSILDQHARRQGLGWYLSAELKVTMPLPVGVVLPPVITVGASQTSLDAAPDLMMAVAENRERSSWKVADEGPPQFVLEVVSEESLQRDLVQKPVIYQVMGVQEYAIYAPHRKDGGPPLLGFRRGDEGRFVAWTVDARGILWSDTLGLGLCRVANDRLRVRDHSGVLLPSLQEEAAATRAQAAAARTEATEAEAARAEAEAARAEAEAARVEAEAARVEAEATRAEAEATRAEAEAARAEAEAARARETALRQAAEAEVARLRAMLD